MRGGCGGCLHEPEQRAELETTLVFAPPALGSQLEDLADSRAHTARVQEGDQPAELTRAHDVETEAVRAESGGHAKVRNTDDGWGDAQFSTLNTG